MTKLSQEVVDFFQLSGFFRLKKPENQRKLFENDLWHDQDAWLEDNTGGIGKDAVFQLLLEYAEELKEKRKRKQAKKLADKNSKPICSGAKSATEHITTLPAGNYVISCAQNNTLVNQICLAALKTYCDANDAKLLIARITYNKSGFAAQDDESTWYDPAVLPYLVEGHLSLDNYAHVLADANVIPTVKNPLTSMAGATESGIHVVVPHVKIALRVSAALKKAPTKILASTGTVTLPNYIMRRTGTVSALEHCHGALFVSTTDKKIRHLELMDGAIGFYDIDKRFYSSEKVSEAEFCVEGLQLGDIHAEKMTKENLQKCVDIVRELNPKNLVLEDISDFSSRNHHNIRCPIFQHEQFQAGNTVKSDLKIVSKTIGFLAKAFDGQVHIVESNHDTAINTWLSRENVIKDDPGNAITYLTCMLALYKHQAKSAGVEFNMLKYAYKAIGGGRLVEPKLNFHSTDESFKIAGVENIHGNHGISGSRGSPAQFRNALGIALNTGHTHTPSICGKVYTAGVAAGILDFSYTKGCSNWAQAHILTYANGQRQIIFN